MTIQDVIAWLRERQFRLDAVADEFSFNKEGDLVQESKLYKERADCLEAYMVEHDLLAKKSREMYRLHLP